MSNSNVPLLFLSNGTHFSTAKNLKLLNHQQQLDTTGNEQRPWMRTRSDQIDRKEKDMLRVLVTDNKEEGNVDSLIKENIRFTDLASLTDEDLQLLGFGSDKNRQHLLNIFKNMPNQDLSYDYICNSMDAQGYNNQIVSNAADQLIYLRSSMASTNYKLQMLPPEDLIVGDKRYASRFALEALKSVQSISNELTKDLGKLEKLASDHRLIKQEKDNGSTSRERNSKMLYYITIAMGTACAWWWWWLKRSNAANFDISVNI